MHLKIFFTAFFTVICMLPHKGFASRSSSESCSLSKKSEPAGNFKALIQAIQNASGELPPHPGKDTKFATVYGKDNRIWIPEGYLWRAIGKLSIGESGTCTATLVGSCYVLTAAHCVSTSSGEAYDVSSLAFQGSNEGPKAKVNRVLYGVGWRQNWKNDWALLRLDTKLGDELGWLGVKNVTGKQITSNMRLKLAGYSKDLGKGKHATVDPNVTVRYYSNESENIIYHNGNSAPGSSGASMFYFDDEGKPWIVGLHTTGVTDSYGDQIQFDGEPKDVNDLASGVATNAFWSKALEQMNRYPCDELKDIVPNQGKSPQTPSK